uniref:Uncharacterized protein n=1 Tax=Populus trichocarpa TaxID=3694 RepID=U5FFC0_POPTR
MPFLADFCPNNCGISPNSADTFLADSTIFGSTNAQPANRKSFLRQLRRQPQHTFPLNYSAPLPTIFRTRKTRPSSDVTHIRSKPNSGSVMAKEKHMFNGSHLPA